MAKSDLREVHITFMKKEGQEITRAFYPVVNHYMDSEGVYHLHFADRERSVKIPRENIVLIEQFPIRE